MRGDFSRLTFNPQKHYRSVYMQQGRVQLDADWNEQNDILNFQLETALKHILGSGGTPRAAAGFQIALMNEPPTSPDDSLIEFTEETQKSQYIEIDELKIRERQPRKPLPLDFSISQGCYYVDGILCANEQEARFSTQPYYPDAPLPAGLHHHAVVYLDVWQRHITRLEDPDLQEVALNGLDTTTRVQTVWQVKLLPVGAAPHFAENRHVTHEDIVALPEWRDLLKRQANKGRLSARYVPGEAALDNQLYRVEIHGTGEKATTFKWSRENGSVVFAIEQIEQIGTQDEQGTVQLLVTFSDLLRDKTLIQKGDWVELENEYLTLRGQTLPLYQVADQPDFMRRQIKLIGPALPAFVNASATYTLLRRWDHAASGPVPDTGTTLARVDTWLDLESGIQIRFSHSHVHEIGDYWLIPARALPATIEWPSDESGPLAQAPHDHQHHYCPLALLHLHHGRWKVASDLRQYFAPLSTTSAFTHAQRTLSEECTSNEHLHTGDLVSLLSPDRLEVARTQSTNTHLVFGVVSGEHIVAGERHYRVTTYGRVHCHVIGPVEQGDLLTASREPGFAARLEREESFLHLGSIVGKALEPYTPDQPDIPGTIAIMVTLQ